MRVVVWVREQLFARVIDVRLKLRERALAVTIRPVQLNPAVTFRHREHVSLRVRRHVRNRRTLWNHRAALRRPQVPHSHREIRASGQKAIVRRVHRDRRHRIGVSLEISQVRVIVQRVIPHRVVVDRRPARALVPRPVNHRRRAVREAHVRAPVLFTVQRARLRAGVGVVEMDRVVVARGDEGIFGVMEIERVHRARVVAEEPPGGHVGHGGDVEGHHDDRAGRFGRRARVRRRARQNGVSSESRESSALERGGEGERRRGRRGTRGG